MAHRYFVAEYIFLRRNQLIHYKMHSQIQSVHHNIYIAQDAAMAALCFSYSLSSLQRWPREAAAPLQVELPKAGRRGRSSWPGEPMYGLLGAKHAHC